MSEDNFPVIHNRAPFFTGNYTFYFHGEPYTIENNKLYDNEHRVAVVYSPGFGGGWSSWYDAIDPTDARVALLTMTRQETKLSLMLRTTDDTETNVRFKDGRFYPWPDSEMSDSLAIEWVNSGTLFRITEYDGAESIERNYDVDWHIA